MEPAGNQATGIGPVRLPVSGYTCTPRKLRPGADPPLGWPTAFHFGIAQNIGPAEDWMGAAET